MSSHPATLLPFAVPVPSAPRALGDPSEELGDLHRTILDSISDGVYLLDTAGRIVYWNAAAERISGFPAAEVIGSRCADSILRHCTSNGTELCETACPMRQTLRDGTLRQRDLWLHHKRGHRIPVSVRAASVKNAAGTIIGCVEVFSDISHRIVALEQAEESNRLAYLDELTAVGNRRSVEARLRELFDDPSGMGMPVGVLFFDIDHFKSFNDLHGHETGDRVLRAVAGTLASNLRSYDLVGRWGGDEFVVVSVATSLHALAGLGERLRSLVQSMIVANDIDGMQVTVSIGGTMTRVGDDVRALIARADAHLYEGKKQGRNCSLVR
ncbi:MAG: diguanylate cyclase [Thermoanaerobaculia bacterium]